MPVRSSPDPRASYFVNINCTELRSTVVDSKTMPPVTYEWYLSLLIIRKHK